MEIATYKDKRLVNALNNLCQSVGKDTPQLRLQRRAGASDTECHTRKSIQLNVSTAPTLMI